MGLTFKKEDRLESMLEDFGIELPEDSKEKFSFKASVKNDEADEKKSKNDKQKKE